MRARLLVPGIVLPSIGDSLCTICNLIQQDTSIMSHPASSKLDLFEGFTKKIVDEGGGYYDSGYIQPVDFFGDDTRIPLLVVAPFLKAPGYISHRYADHVSILKFIERNWGLRLVTNRSRDNFPNPVSFPGNR